MIISIDFDGTIVQNQFPEIGELMHQAKESIQYLFDNGHKIIINTCRDGKHLLDAINFLLHHNIPFHRVNDNLPENTEKYGSNSRKVYAHRYIDDRNIGGFPGWHACIADIEKTEAQHLSHLTDNRSDGLHTVTPDEPVLLTQHGGPISASYVSDAMVDIGHNTYFDKLNPHKGYFFLTKNGFNPYCNKDKKCPNCKKIRTIPDGVQFCSDCWAERHTF